jgi:hypothetical protein
VTLLVSFKNSKYLHDFIEKKMNDNYPYHLMKKYLHNRRDIKILKSFMIYRSILEVIDDYYEQLVLLYGIIHRLTVTGWIRKHNKNIYR